MSEESVPILLAISPLDGRYWSKVKPLSEYFSEFALIKYRVKVEIEYFIALCKIPLPQLENFNLNEEKEKLMRSWFDKFSLEDAAHIKKIEATTNHDVKAVEYFLKEKFDQQGWKEHKEFLHFALTSQDINNTAIPLTLKGAMEHVYLPGLEQVIKQIRTMGENSLKTPMLAHTHGQPATPTRVGKELLVFVERLMRQKRYFKHIPFAAKFGGATGCLNAHAIAYPKIDWVSFANSFVSGLGLEREQYTTQISHYDELGAVCDTIKRINTILIDFARDMWTYISLEYFSQQVVANEVGSSAMPHKVNPIDFENAEGNLGVANVLLDHFALKLPISRMQRDLTDSTVLRNLGVPFAHSLMAFHSFTRALSRIAVNPTALHTDLEENWEVVAEAIQTVLRRERVDKPYEKLKALTRTGTKTTQHTLTDFIDNSKELSDLSPSLKSELKLISPHNFIGVLPDPKILDSLK